MTPCGSVGRTVRSEGREDVAETWDGRNTMVCTYGGGVSVLTTGGGKPSESAQYTAEEALKLAAEIADVARRQLNN